MTQFPATNQPVLMKYVRERLLEIPVLTQRNVDLTCSVVLVLVKLHFRLGTRDAVGISSAQLRRHVIIQMEVLMETVFSTFR